MHVRHILTSNPNQSMIHESVSIIYQIYMRTVLT